MLQFEQEVSKHDLPSDKTTNCMRAAAPRLQQERRREPNECEGLYGTPHMDSTTFEGSSTDGESSYASLETEIEALQVSAWNGSARSRRGGLRPNPAPNQMLKDYVL